MCFYGITISNTVVKIKNPPSPALFAQGYFLLAVLCNDLFNRLLLHY